MNGDVERVGGEHRELAEWDGAYVLGALTPADRRRYERHLSECARCRQSAAELADMPVLLARAGRPPSAVRPPAEMPERSCRQATRHRRGTRRWLLAGAAAAAALLGLLGGVVWGDSAGSQEPTAQLVLQPVEVSAMSARVGVSTVPWGTRLTVECAHPEQSAPPGGGSYVLVVIDRAGEESRLSSWNAVPGRTITLDAATSLPVEEIAAIELRGRDDELLFRGTR